EGDRDPLLEGQGDQQGNKGEEVDPGQTRTRVGDLLPLLPSPQENQEENQNEEEEQGPDRPGEVGRGRDPLVELSENPRRQDGPEEDHPGDAPGDGHHGSTATDG